MMRRDRNMQMLKLCVCMCVIRSCVPVNIAWISEVISDAWDKCIGVRYLHMCNVHACIRVQCSRVWVGVVLVCKVFMRLLMELIPHFTARRDSHEKHKSQSSALTSAVCVCALQYFLWYQWPLLWTLTALRFCFPWTLSLVYSSRDLNQHLSLPWFMNIITVFSTVRPKIFTAIVSGLISMYFSCISVK